MLFSLVEGTLPKGFKVQSAVAQTIRLNHTNVFFFATCQLNLLFRSGHLPYMCRFVDSNINFPQCIHHQTISPEIFTLYINKSIKQLASHSKITNSPKAAITLCPKEASINGTMG